MDGTTLPVETADIADYAEDLGGMGEVDRRLDGSMRSSVRPCPRACSVYSASSAAGLDSVVCRGEQAGLIRRDRYDVIRACHRDQVLGDDPLGVHASTMTTLPTGSTSATSRCGRTRPPAAVFANTLPVDGQPPTVARPGGLDPIGGSHEIPRMTPVTDWPTMGAARQDDSTGTVLLDDQRIRNIDHLQGPCPICR